MTASVTALRPRLDSPGFGSTGALGATMDVLDLVERLLVAAEHPDIVQVDRYGPGDGPWGPDSDLRKVRGISGVKVIHQSTATASLWLAVWPGEQPVDPPPVLPAPAQNRAPRLAILVDQLLTAARPAQLRAWRLVTLPGLGDQGTQAGLPSGVSLAGVDGSRWLLRATAAGPSVGSEPAEDPFPDYRIPAGVAV